MTDYDSFIELLGKICLIEYFCATEITTGVPIKSKPRVYIIALVEDDEMLRANYANVLIREGYKVVT